MTGSRMAHARPAGAWRARLGRWVDSDPVQNVIIVNTMQEGVHADDMQQREQIEARSGGGGDGPRDG